ncbi:UNVERIFIED_CONTAM: ATPase of 26S proteasome regulatory subunit 4, partial [Siphonaria sp. JEL0065]
MIRIIGFGTRFYSTPSTPRIVNTIAEYRALRNQWLKDGKTIGFVPTMGALHSGHLSLAKAAKKDCDKVVASIFVNPAQFAPTEDLDRYPRTFEADVKLLGSVGVDAVFSPAVQEMYPAGIVLDVSKQTGAFVEVKGKSHMLEGSVRPHFFRGVATVVTKLFNVIQPHKAFFGQKDGQQCAVIRTMVRDLLIPTEVVVCQTIREQDGLAMSSRNRYLSPEERQLAPVLYRALKAAEDLYVAGERNANVLTDAGNKVLKESGVPVEYLSVANSLTLEEEAGDVGKDGAMMSGAVRIGKTRIIDNILLGVEGANQSNIPGAPGGGKKDDGKKKEKKWEQPLPTRVGKKKKKGPDAVHKLPQVFPTTRCKLKLLKNERIKDFLLLEEEFVQNQERLKPQDEKNQEERSRVDELRGTPMNVGSLEEIIDDDHAIVSTVGGTEYYVSIMSYVDKDLLEPSGSILLHHKNLAVVGVLGDDADPMVSVMKLEKAPTESYADVGGLDQQIQEIKEAVELPLTHPELYEEMGIKPPKGVILFGPPGTGKTLLAKAVANQTSATFLRVVGSELIQKYLGEGPKLVRELFRVAEENAPSIVFIDEIDAVGTKRYDSNSGGEREIQRTMLELLNQLDGFDSRGDVKVIMATNRIDSLDP